MSIISGQDTRLQIGLANTWRTPTRTKQRLPFTSESFKGIPNYKEAEALVGASGITSMAIMSYAADGGFSSYVTIDQLRILLLAALGAEAASAASGTQYKHKYTPVASGLCANLPSLTVEVDRILEKAIYSNFKLNDWTLSGSAEDYIMFEANGPAYKENIQDALLRFKAPAGSTLTTITLGAGVIAADGEFVGKVLVAQLDCGEKAYFDITDSVALGGVLTIATKNTGQWLHDTPASIVGYDCRIYDFEMAPAVPLTTMEYLRFVHGILYMDLATTPYYAQTDAKDGDIVLDVPITLTGEAGFEIYVEVTDPSLAVRVYKYIGAAITRGAETLTFADTPVGADNIKSVFTSADVLNDTVWEVVENAYDEITQFSLSGDNAIQTGRFGMNSSLYQSEVNPSSRSFNLDVTSRFTSRLSELRKKRMLTGTPVAIRLEFETRILDGLDGETKTSEDAVGNTYKVIVDMPKCYYTDGVANISGPDEPEISPKFICAETVGVHKAVEITVYDAENATTAAGYWAVAAREDGYTG